MRQSMSGTGNGYDNATMESYWHSLKVEKTHGQDFATRAAAEGAHRDTLRRCVCRGLVQHDAHEFEPEL